MNINREFPSNSDLLKATDLPEMKPFDLIIASCEKMVIGQGENADEKPVLSFQGHDKKLALSPTKWGPIVKAYGPETDGWIGKTVRIWHDPTVTFGKNVTGGIKLMVPKPTPAQAAVSAEAGLMDPDDPGFDPGEDVPF